MDSFILNIDGSYFILANIERLRVPDDELRATEAEEARFCLGGKVPHRSRDWQVHLYF